MDWHHFYHCIVFASLANTSIDLAEALALFVRLIYVDTIDTNVLLVNKILVPRFNAISTFWKSTFTQHQTYHMKVKISSNFKIHRGISKFPL